MAHKCHVSKSCLKTSMWQSHSEKENKTKKKKKAEPIPETYSKVFGAACRFHTQVLVGQ